MSILFIEIKIIPTKIFKFFFKLKNKSCNIMKNLPSTQSVGLLNISLHFPIRESFLRWVMILTFHKLQTLINHTTLTLGTT